MSVHYSTSTTPHHDHGPEVVPFGYSNLEPVPLRKPEYAYAVTAQPIHQKEPKKILGLRRTTFFLSIALAIAVAVAGVVGGVLGSQLGTQCLNACSPEEILSDGAGPESTGTSTSLPTATTDLTNYVAPTEATLKLDCSIPNPVEALWVPGDRKYHYEVTCGEDCPGYDILTVWAYSMAHCVHACFSFNEARDFVDGNEDTIECKDIVWTPEMEKAERHGGNCFLKTGCDDKKEQDGTVFAHAIFV